jgi:hypothetical protein
MSESKKAKELSWLGCVLKIIICHKKRVLVPKKSLSIFFTDCPFLFCK